MSILLSNILLALVWIFLWEQVDMFHFLQGFALGYLVLYLFRGFLPDSGYFRRTYAFLRYLLYFLRQNIVNSVRVARASLRADPAINPGFLRLELDGDSNLEITWFANTISLIPGTLSVDTSPDAQYLYVHAMFLDDVEETRRELEDELEPMILGFLR